MSSLRRYFCREWADGRALSVERGARRSVSCCRGSQGLRNSWNSAGTAAWWLQGGRYPGSERATHTAAGMAHKWSCGKRSWCVWKRTEHSRAHLYRRGRLDACPLHTKPSTHMREFLSKLALQSLELRGRLGDSL